ncbi:PhzF family phenazine biosynthesis protein [Sediminicurvatus halobius]|uniref:PhzF family phenazine biosynthesis protein n=1 Tax=Sediminicurvatus halobius TaxID=2182432 RepID=A0A2U2N0C4_9GAMM|nr:PhzF family phenazine biosynthesis protein [Spiribacter halobius]PWG62414.1 PhzF family phenazine biosynthesis protein [Spiribacter halobius]UEX79515.1 PhzF family phenazine biosynthesis protein [Spiribacter halobius]
MQVLAMMQVDAFTRRPYGGNPCAVVFDADDLSRGTMQTIAREMNLSETAFLMRSSRADFRARYFTPGEEIPLAGHPTIAAIYGLLSSGRLHREGACQVKLELQVGVIDIDITGAPGDPPLITMTQPRPEFLRVYEPQEVCPAFGLTPDDLLPDVPVQTVSTGTPQLMIPVRSLHSLRRVHLDHVLYAQLREFGDFFSAHLFTPEGVEHGDTFARHFGVPPEMTEDPFTGSATGGMAAYLWHHQLIRHPHFTAEQGHWMGRPGEALVEVIGQPEYVQAVRVGGHATEILEGSLLVPDETP